jgi:hypothetical protein
MDCALVLLILPFLIPLLLLAPEELMLSVEMAEVAMPARDPDGRVGISPDVVALLPPKGQPGVVEMDDIVLECDIVSFLGCC